MQGSRLLALAADSYTPKQLYAIIADIDAYSTFIPYLSHSKVLSSSSSAPLIRKDWLEGGLEGETQELKAELGIGFAALSQSYVSAVKCRKWDIVTVSTRSFLLLETR